MFSLCRGPDKADRDGCLLVDMSGSDDQTGKSGIRVRCYIPSGIISGLNYPSAETLN